MGAGRIGFFVFCLCLILVFGAWILGQTTDYAWQSVANVAILCFVFFGSLVMVAVVAFSEAVYNLMEQSGDNCLKKGNLDGAYAWYKRCLWVQETIVCDEWHRLSILGKIAIVDEEKAGDELEPTSRENLKTRLDKANVKENRPAGRSAFAVSPAVANSILYKYAFAILFGLVAITYALHGKTVGAFIVLLVGAVLNAYWLGKGSDS